VSWTRKKCRANCDTFGHAVQAAQVASLRDTDAQIVVLTVELVGQEVGEWLCLFDGLSPVERVDMRLW
jgi:hypothetical protein